MTFPTNAPQGDQRRPQRSAQPPEQAVTIPVSPDEIDFSRLMEEQFQVAVAEEEAQLAQERRQRL
jgi:hypothetical protein